jgi:ferrous iron transport protein B
MPLLRIPTVALLGNPNTGKTTLFNALAGMRQRVGNYPGVTVETKKGRMTVHGQTIDLIDLPGTYSLAPRSPDEMVAVDLLLGEQPGEPRPDAILAIVDASNLERNLYLTSQALELGIPVVVALNMTDVAESQKLHVDAERLAKQLGVRVVPTQANRGKGLAELKEAISAAVFRGSPENGAGTGHSILSTQNSLPGAAHNPLQFPENFECEAAQLRDHIGGHIAPFLVRRLLLDVGGYTEKRFTRMHDDLSHDVQVARQRLAEAGCPVPAVEARARYGWIRQATAGCIQRPDARPVTWTDRLDKVLTHRIWGTLVFLVLMFCVFEAIFLIADPVKNVFDVAKGWLAIQLESVLPAGPFRDLLTDGVLKGVGSVVVFLPQIVILFGFIAILEDCGYMARAAFLMDKLMARCGLSGKSFIPMLSSVACAVPGIMATRVIENRRDRLATILVAPLMSCSARLPVYTLLIGAFLPVRSEQNPDGYPWWTPGLVMFAMYGIGLTVAPLVALALKRTLLRGETPVFVMEMPLYKWPSLWTVIGRMKDSGMAFLRRAGTLILAAMILVWALLYFPRALPQPQSIDDAEVATYPEKLAALDDLIKERKEQGEEVDELEQQRKDAAGEWKRQSILGRFGQAIEPAVRPLGWDWKIGTAALASFPAREVVVATLGLIYNEGEEAAEDVSKADNVAATGLGQSLRREFGDKGLATALSLMVFFALCCQCASTLVVIRRETNSWRWPAFTFLYMTALAYFGAFLVYQVGSWLV